MRKYQERFMYGEAKPKILIFKEKHGTWHFVTHDAVELSMALLTVVENRLEEGWYLDELYGDDVPKEGVDSGQIDMFKKTDLPKTDKEQAQAIIDMARSDIENAVIEAGAEAYEFLQSHTDYEYKGFEVEYPATPTFSLTPS